ncbi:MAG TPA: hypothetical protein VGF75_05680 [Candidatus Saccharimonadales bacterium]|jgi:hypothetical protein
MRPLIDKLRPTAGFAHVLHIALLVFLPVAVFILVRLDFVQLAFSLVLLSKWRMVAVRPRFWPANIRANAVDIVVGLSIVLFMIHAPNLTYQLAWVVLYAIWLIVIKPAGSLLMVSVQAFIGQLCGLMALYLAWANGPLYGLTLLTGIICYFAARHFFDSFDEPYAKLLAYTWGYFAAALAWLLAHWLIYYRFLSQPTLLLSTLGYGLAVIYYLDHNEKLSKSLRRQFVLVMVAVVLVVLTFSNWGAKVV